MDNSKEYHCGDCLLVECEDVTRFHAVGKVICSLPPLPKNIPTNQLFSNDKKLILDLFCYVCCKLCITLYLCEIEILICFIK